MEEPERGSSSSSSVSVNRASSEAGTASSSSSSHVRQEEEVDGGHFPPQNRFRPSELEEQQIGPSYWGSFRVFGDNGSAAIVQDDICSCVIVLVTFWFFSSYPIYNSSVLFCT